MNVMDVVVILNQKMSIVAVSVVELIVKLVCANTSANKIQGYS